MWRLMTYLCSVCLLLLAIPTEAITLQAGATYSSQTVSVSEAPDALPTAALYVNNTLDATPVTVTLKPGSTRSYYCTVTLPGGLSTGDRVEIRVDATVSATALEPGWLSLGIVETPVSVAVTTLESRHTTNDAALASAVTTINDNTNVRQLETLGEIATGNGGNNIQNILSATSQIDSVVDALPTEAQITAAASGGPIEHRRPPEANIVSARSKVRGQGGCARPIYLSAGGGRALCGIRVGSRLAYGDYVDAMQSPSLTAGNLTVDTTAGEFGFLGELLIFHIDTSAATAGDKSTLTIDYSPHAGQSDRITCEIVAVE